MPTIVDLIDYVIQLRMELQKTQAAAQQMQTQLKANAEKDKKVKDK